MRRRLRLQKPFLAKLDGRENLERPASSLEPRASSVQPPASSLEPRASSVQPQASSLERPASSLEPRASSVKPRASRHERPASSLEPQASSLKPRASRNVSRSSGDPLGASRHLSEPLGTSGLPLGRRAWPRRDSNPLRTQAAELGKGRERHRLRLQKPFLLKKMAGNLKPSVEP